MKFYRARKRDAGNRVPLPDDLGAPPGSDLLHCYGSFCTPSRILSEREQVERVEAAFDSLSESEREVITLARIARLSHPEIAEHMGCTVGAVRMRLFRALERLSELLE